MDKFYINSIPVYRSIVEDNIQYILFQDDVEEAWKHTSNIIRMNKQTPEDIQFQTILNIIREITQEDLTVYKVEE